MIKKFVCNCGAEYELFEKNYPCRNNVEEKCDFCSNVIVDYINPSKAYGVRLVKRPTMINSNNEKVKKLFPGK